MSKDNDKPKKKRKNEQQLKRQGSRIVAYARQVREQYPDLPWRECMSRGAKMLKEENMQKKSE